MSRPITKTRPQKFAAGIQPASDRPELPRGFSQDRARLRGKYPAEFGFKQRRALRAAQVDDGD